MALWPPRSAAAQTIVAHSSSARQFTCFPHQRTGLFFLPVLFLSAMLPPLLFQRLPLARRSKWGRRRVGAAPSCPPRAPRLFVGDKRGDSPAAWTKRWTNKRGSSALGRRQAQAHEQRGTAASRPQGPERMDLLDDTHGREAPLGKDFEKARSTARRRPRRQPP